MNQTELCPCGTGIKFSDCCERYHRGEAAPTPEALMRSRYSAYVVNQIDYIARTNDPETGSDFDEKAAKEWAEQSEWQGLEIVAASGNEVEFKARFRAHDRDEIHHEVSLFRKDEKNGRWYYRDGKTIREPEVRAAPKQGRNDPCACGSGKKFKKCHSA